MTRTQLNQFVLDKRLNGSAENRSVSFLGDPRSYSRHSCKVTMEAGAVKAAEYSFAD